MTDIPDDVRARLLEDYARLQAKQVEQLRQIDVMLRQIDAIETTLEEHRAWNVRLDLADVSHTERTEALESALTDATATNGGDITRTAPINWQYRSVYDWVEQWFVVTFRRSIARSTRWCAHWWAHEEALIVLTALWRTWEQARLDTTAGIARWLTTTAYPLLDRLWSSEGTFSQCTVERCQPRMTLAYVTAPEANNHA